MAISVFPDPWTTPRRIFHRDRTFTFATPASQYGDFNPNGFGDFNRVVLMSEEAKRIEGSYWVDEALADLRWLYNSGKNSEFFKRLVPLEHRLENEIRKSLGGPPKWPSPPPDVFVETRPAQKIVEVGEIQEVLNSLLAIGVTFEVEAASGQVWYRPKSGAYIPTPQQRQTLQHSPAVLRDLLGPAAVAINVKTNPLSRRIEALYPEHEPTWIPPAWAMMEPEEAPSAEAAEAAEAVEAVEAVEAEPAPSVEAEAVVEAEPAPSVEAEAVVEAEPAPSVEAAEAQNLTEISAPSEPVTKVKKKRRARAHEAEAFI